MEEPRQRGELAEASPLFHKETTRSCATKKNFVEYLTSPFFLEQSGASSFQVGWVSKTTRSKDSRCSKSAQPSLQFLVTKPSGPDEELPIFFTPTLSIHLKKELLIPHVGPDPTPPVPLYKLLHHLFRHSVRQPDTNQQTQTASAILRGPPPPRFRA